jgi:hypothetical protein
MTFGSLVLDDRAIGDAEDLDPPEAVRPSTEAVRLSSEDDNSAA